MARNREHQIAVRSDDYDGEFTAQTVQTVNKSGVYALHITTARKGNKGHTYTLDHVPSGFRVKGGIRGRAEARLILRFFALHGAGLGQNWPFGEPDTESADWKAMRELYLSF
jgi:hypothetical protein